MAESTASAHWSYRGLYLLLVAIVGFAQLLPFSPGPGTFPGPDVILLITCAWVVRRPDFLPTLLIAAVFLLGDVIFMRPLGLWAAFVVMGTEFLRMRAVAWRDLNFLLEWFMVAGVLSAMTLVNRLVLWVIFVDQPALGLTLIRLLGTIAVYPLVVLLAARFFGLRKLAPGAVDRLGHKH